MMEEKKLTTECLDDAAQSVSELRDYSPWYAIKLYTTRQKEAADYFQNKGLETFIPEEYMDIEDKNHGVKHVLRPVVRNLIFLKKEGTEAEMRNLVTMCNPQLTMRKYLSEEQAHLKKGDKVLVKHGPLKGLTGRLVRSNKMYYLLKEVPGMAIMIKVTRWCCEKI